MFFYESLNNAQREIADSRRDHNGKRLKWKNRQKENT